MADILLLNPTLPLAITGGKKHSSVGAVLPPLGILYLANVLEKEGFSVEVLDSILLDLTDEEIIRRINNNETKIIGIYCMTPNYSHILSLCNRIMNKIIILGGPHPSIFPKEVLNNEIIDYVIYGEGEYSLVELMHFLKKRKGSISEIRGMGWKKGKELIINPPRKFIDNLDEIPFPALHLIDVKKYVPSPTHYKRLPMMTMITSRGCPYSCTFCSSSRLWGRRYRTRSVENVIEEINLLRDRYGIREICFWDDIFGVNKRWVLDFCRRIRQEKIDITWSCECRVDCVDKEMLKEMASAGCWNVFYGIESMDQEILDAINKRTTIEQINNALKWTKEAGIEIRANYIIALPRETPQKVENMLKEINRLNPDFVKFNVLTPYPGTQLYDEISKGRWGRMTNEFDKLNTLIATFVPYGYKDLEEVRKMQRKASWSFFMRPRYFIQRLLKIRNLRDLKRDINGLRIVISRYI